MYVKFNPRWLPFPNTSTPITDKALDHIEQGITDVDVTRPGTPAEVALSSRLSASAGSAEGLVQAERAAREAAVAAEQSARVAAIEAETAARKTAIIGESDARIAALALKANADAVYTKAQVDAAVSPKANSVDVYTKAQSDTGLSLKANKTDVYTKAETYSRTETGTQITNAITASRPPLYGTGFPNGKVAAPVGTLYADEAVTNGASLWQKSTGTGTSGWAVVAGDTGWRNILNDPAFENLLKPAGIELQSARIMRSNQDVYWAVALKKTAAATVDTSGLPGGTAPTGFRVNQIGSVLGSTSALELLRIYLPTSGAFIYQGPTTAAFAAANFSYRTSDPWPSTLPGTN